MQRVFGHAWMDQPFFLQLLLEAPFDGFIQFAPFAFSIGVDCKRIARQLVFPKPMFRKFGARTLVAPKLRARQWKSCALS